MYNFIKTTQMPDMKKDKNYKTLISLKKDTMIIMTYYKEKIWEEKKIQNKDREFSYFFHQVRLKRCMSFEIANDYRSLKVRFVAWMTMIAS